MSIVSIQKVNYNEPDLKKEVYNVVRKSMEETKWKNSIKKGGDTLLKVNMCWADFLLPGMCTSPWVLGAVIDVIRDHVGKIYVGEGLAAAFQSFKKGCKNNHWDKVAKEYGVELRDLSKDRYVNVRIPNVPFPVVLSKFARDVDNYISLPLLKTHSVTVFTGALKNQFGVTFGKRILYHLNLNDVIIGINKIIEPNFTVMDGTIGTERNGPANGKPKIMNLVLSSSDLVALDNVACKIMKINPNEVEYLNLARELNYGDPNPKIIGPRIESISQRFERAGPQGYYEKGMLPLLKSRFKDFVYNYFWIPGRFAVKNWRDLWYLREGRGYTRKILKTKYGKQWLD